LGECKVCDFGLAASVNATQSNSVGKYFYMAPEMYCNAPYDVSKADVWSLGIMLVIMLTGSPIFNKADESDSTFRYVEVNGFHSVLDAWKLKHLVPPSAMDLLEKMLVIDASTRISMADVMNHKFVSGANYPSTLKSIRCISPLLTMNPNNEAVKCKDAVYAEEECSILAPTVGNNNNETDRNPRRRFRYLNKAPFHRTKRVWPLEKAVGNILRNILRA